MVMISFVTQSLLWGSSCRFSINTYLQSDGEGMIALWRIQQCIRGIIVPSENASEVEREIGGGSEGGEVVTMTKATIYTGRRRALSITESSPR